MSFWNHRVIHRYHEEYDTHTYHIHEVYYDENGSIEGWTESAMEPFGETPSELREDIRYFIKAFQKPILIVKIKDGKEILVPDEPANARLTCIVSTPDVIRGKPRLHKCVMLDGNA